MLDFLRDQQRSTIELALRMLGASHWAWHLVPTTCGRLLVKRTPPGARAAALIAHDRILCREVDRRGLPW